MATAPEASILFSNISGKIGDVVYFRNWAGVALRAYAVPLDPPSPAKAVIRGNFASIAYAWTLLSAADQQQWNQCSSFLIRRSRVGIKYAPSGRQLFFTRNMNILMTGGVILNLPGTSSPLVPVSKIILLYCSSASIQMMITFFNSATNFPPDHCLLIFATNNTKPSLNNLRHRFRLIAAINYPSPLSFLLLPDFVTTWGNYPQHGKKIGFCIYAVNTITGQASPKLYQEVIVS